MARKTIADLEEELRLEKEKSAGLQMEIDTVPVADIQTGDEIDLAAENAELKKALAANKSHTAESESRLMSMIKGMEEAGGDTGACLTFTPDEYKAYSAESGLIMGRKPDQKVKCTIEELRAAINSDKTPSWLMEKTGMTENDLQQLIWRLSAKELRDNPIKLNIKRDFFGKEA